MDEYKSNQEELKGLIDNHVADENGFHHANGFTQMAQPFIAASELREQEAKLQHEKKTLVYANRFS